MVDGSDPIGDPGDVIVVLPELRGIEIADIRKQMINFPFIHKKLSDYSLFVARNTALHAESMVFLSHFMLFLVVNLHLHTRLS